MPAVTEMRLQFNVVRDCTGYWSCSTPFMQHSYDITRFYDIPHRADGYVARSHFDGVSVVGRAESYDECVAICQADFDGRWREATEVPDLVWQPYELTNGAKMLVSGKYVISQTGVSFNKWEAQFDYRTIAEELDSDELAQAACNAHNRDSILGRTNQPATKGAGA